MSSMIYQSEAAECGLACLAMISNHFGYEVDMNSLRQRYPQTLKGATLEQLISIASELNLAGRAIKLNLEDLNKLKVPCVIHWDLNHFVVLKKVARKKVIIMDPAFGVRTLDIQHVGKHFTGIALELAPTHQFKKKDVRRTLSIPQLLGRTDGLIPALIKVLILSLFLQVFVLVSPYYLQLVLDEVVTSFDDRLLFVLAVGFALVQLFNVAITVLRSYMVIHLGYILSQHLAFNLFNHLIYLPTQYFYNRHLGDIVSRFESLKRIKHVVSSNVVEAILDGIMSVTTLVMIYIYSVKLALVVTIAILCYLILRIVWYRPLRHLSEEAIIASANEKTNFMEYIRGIQTVKLATLESSSQSNWQNKYTKSLNLTTRIERLNVIYNACKTLLFGIENVVVICIGGQLIISSNEQLPFTIGMLTAFMAYKAQFTRSSAAFIEKFIDFKMVGIDLDRLADIALTDREQNKEPTVTCQITGKLELRGLSYRFSSAEEYTLEGVSCVVNPGERLVVVGKSGAGKSTLIRVILGLLPVDQGDVLVDDVNLKELGYKQFRSQIATVMQEDQLFSGSIADNISLFDSELDMGRIYTSAHFAAIHEDIVSMPMGYSTLIGDMGTSLSGGQKQRVLLARALYRRPKILFLDESSS
ncbi:peptidase domain-containing ABC transporter, partial [Vibrio diabolicus]|uniref:peptidase domain-containing ABC transporter n=2 Tax=Vibrio TaxID=662 RepID=UPI002940FE3A